MDLESLKRKDNKGYDYYFASEVYEILGYMDIQDMLKDIYKYEEGCNDDKTFGIEFNDYILSNRACKYLAYLQRNIIPFDIVKYFYDNVELEQLTTKILVYMDIIDKLNKRICKYKNSNQKDGGAYYRHTLNQRIEVLSIKSELISNYVYKKER